MPHEAVGNSGLGKFGSVGRGGSSGLGSTGTSGSVVSARKREARTSLTLISSIAKNRMHIFLGQFMSGLQSLIGNSKES